jgi:hypothetical protein
MAHVLALSIKIKRISFERWKDKDVVRKNMKDDKNNRLRQKNVIQKKNKKSLFAMQNCRNW